VLGLQPGLARHEQQSRAVRRLFNLSDACHFAIFLRPHLARNPLKGAARQASSAISSLFGGRPSRAVDFETSEDQDLAERHGTATRNAAVSISRPRPSARSRRIASARGGTPSCAPRHLSIARICARGM
jgi:hypothetical protein